MSKRKRLMINWSVQGPLLVRLATHIVTFAAAMASLVMLCWLIQQGTIKSALGDAEEPLGNFWYRFLPLMASAITILPFMIYDVLKITNRIAGPLYRFEVLMKEFEETGVLPKAKLRQNDLLFEFCNRFNSFADVMHSRYPDCNPAETETAPESTLERQLSDSARMEEPVLV